MAVSLPTAADVRKVREQAAQAVNRQAELARTPLLAVLGATDAAATAVTEALAKARARTTEGRAAASSQAERMQHRINELPDRLSSEELRRNLNALSASAKKIYAELAERGEQTWSKLRQQPQVARVLKQAQETSERLEGQIDGIVDDVHDAAEDALKRVSRTTRSTGEKVAQDTQRFAAQAAETVADAGSDAAEAIVEAGDEAAHDTRSASRKAANRTQPRKTTK